MKTIPILAFLAALAALLFAPLNFETACSLLFAAGLGCIFSADYTRRPSIGEARPAAVVRLAPVARRARALELAA